MNKWVFFLLVLVGILGYANFASAHDYHHGPRIIYIERNNWIAPLIVGSLVTYGIMKANEEPKVIYVERQRTEPVYKKVLVFYDNCNCYRETFIRVAEY